VLALEAERAGHAAAAGIEMIEVEADLLQHKFFRLELHDRFVVAVALNDRFPFHLRDTEAVAGVLNEFTQRLHRHSCMSPRGCVPP